MSQRSAGHGKSVGVCGDWRGRKRAARCVCRSAGSADARRTRAFGAGRADGSVSNRRSLRRRELPAFRWEEVSAGGQAGADIACDCDCASNVQPAEHLHVVASGGNSCVLAVSTSRDAYVWGERNDDRCRETADAGCGAVEDSGKFKSKSQPFGFAQGRLSRGEGEKGEATGLCLPP